MLAGIEDIHEDSSSVSCSSHVSTLHLTAAFAGYKVNMWSGLHVDMWPCAILCTAMSLKQNIMQKTIINLLCWVLKNPFYERYSSYASQTSWDCLHVSKTLAIRKRYACPSIRYHQIQAALETRKCILVDKAKAS